MSKSNTGARLAEQRRLKGWTQEELAEKAGVTTLAIQRIENGSVNPQAYTLKLLAKSLDIDFRDLVDEPAGQPEEQPLRLPSAETDERISIQTFAESRFLVLMHLLPLSMVIIPAGNILLPLLVWVMKKDAYEEYDIHGRAVLNFQLTMTLIIIVSIVLLILHSPVGFPLFVVSGIYTIGLCILNAVNVATGKRIRYPLSIAFLKKVPVK